jgi:hypothetical protein
MLDYSALCKDLGVNSEEINSKTLPKIEDRVGHYIRFEIAKSEFEASGEYA